MNKIRKLSDKMILRIKRIKKYTVIKSYKICQNDNLKTSV